MSFATSKVKGKGMHERHRPLKHTRGKGEGRSCVNRSCKEKGYSSALSQKGEEDEDRQHGREPLCTGRRKRGKKGESLAVTSRFSHIKEKGKKSDRG